MPERARPAKLAEVAVSLPVEGTFDYRVPSSLIKSVAPGKRVLVPFGKKKVVGYVMGFPEKTSVPGGRLKDISDVLDTEPLLPEHSMGFLQWASRYYFTPLGLVLKAALPAGINPGSRKCYGITEQGRKALEDGDLEPGKREILDTLAELEDVPASQLESILGFKENNLLFKRLVSDGCIEKKDKIKRARVGERSMDYLVLKKGADHGIEETLLKRAPEQARMFKMIKERGQLSICEAGEHFKNPRALARALASRGLVQMKKSRVIREPLSNPLSADVPPKKLSADQRSAIKELETALRSESFAPYLLHGVTGSGKTEIYIRIIKAALERGRSALMLVPEISLTPQLIKRFETRFSPDIMASLHSGLSPGERFDQWHKIRSGKAVVVIGARSAVFAPLDNLGVIVVDEEHEAAYKQDEKFPYQARDLAVFRALEQKCLVVLGSATPSLESACNAETGKYGRLLLNTRIDKRPLPDIEVVDLREKYLDQEEQAAHQGLGVKDSDRLFKREIFSNRLREALIENAQAGHQSLVFLNRRGFASFLVCLDCGTRFTCPNCAVSLTWHEKSSAVEAGLDTEKKNTSSYLLCHHCGYRVPAPEVCPQCLGLRLVNFGIGTERIEDELKSILPDSRIARMDRDTMQNRAAYFEIINMLERREVDVLIGTQMVAKGHDLPGVTLVGVLLADLSLNFPDFRAGERTFQLITQVAGRAGRGEHPGKVIIQTLNPDHYSIRCALNHDYNAFYAREMEVRKALGYPPWGRLANFRLSSTSAKAAAEGAGRLVKTARKISRRKDFRDKVKLLGPAPAPLSKLRGRTRWQMLVRAPSPRIISAYCAEVMEQISGKSFAAGVRIDLDRDPVNLL